MLTNTSVTFKGDIYKKKIVLDKNIIDKITSQLVLTRKYKSGDALAIIKNSYVIGNIEVVLKIASAAYLNDEIEDEKGCKCFTRTSSN